jgi:hypothetical protein
MKTTLFATLLLAGGALLAQAPQYGQYGAPPPQYGAQPQYGQQPQYGDPNGYQDPNGYYGDQAPPPYAAPAPPPVPPAYAAAPPPAPGPGYFWVDPYWNWVGGSYVYVNGYWGLPPYAGAYWVAPRYYGGHYYAGYWGGRGGVVVHNYGYGYRGGYSGFGHAYVAPLRPVTRGNAFVAGHATVRSGGAVMRSSGHFGQSHGGRR